MQAKTNCVCILFYETKQKVEKFFFFIYVLYFVFVVGGVVCDYR